MAFLLSFYISIISPSEAAEPIAKIQGILINADSMFRDTDQESVELDGHVQLVYQDQHITCQKARISLRSRKVELLGGVSIVSPRMTIGGDHILLDYETNTGIIYNGYVQAGSVIFEGSLLEKVSDREFYVSNAEYTTCKNCPSTWSFSGSSIRAELGGYAYIKNSVMRVGSFPIFWLPYLIVPLQSERQSGLLTPVYKSNEQSGSELGQSYFWAINRSSDATFTFKNYELRGQKYLAEYRYALTENSWGKLSYGGISDQIFKDEDRLNSFRSRYSRGKPIDRWFTKYDHYIELPNDYVFRAKLRNTSDLQYPIDFKQEMRSVTDLEREIEAGGEPALENRLSMSKNTKDQHLRLEVDHYTNLLHENPLATNDDAVHRLPEVQYSKMISPIANTNLLYSIDMTYTQFSRNGLSYDNLDELQLNSQQKIRYLANYCNTPSSNDKPLCQNRYDGQFNSNRDLIRTGQRLDLMPSLYRPFTVAEAFEFVPKVSYRETHYQFDVGDDPTNIRRYLRTELSARTTVGKVFGDSTGFRSEMWKHEIQPELTVTHLPWIDHKSHHFFGFSKQAEAPVFNRRFIDDNDTGSDSGLQFDYTDRIYDRSLVTYAVTNKFIQKRWLNSNPNYRQVALFRLSQSFDAYENSRDVAEDVKQPWSDLAGLFQLNLDNFQTYASFNYYPYHKVTDMFSIFSVNDDEGRFAEAGISRQYKVVHGQDSASQATRIEDYIYGIGLISKHLNVLGRVTVDNNYDTTENRTQKRIKSYRAAAQLKPPGECWILTFQFSKDPVGERNFTLAMDFNFDGKPAAPPTKAILDTF